MVSWVDTGKPRKAEFAVFASRFGTIWNRDNVASRDAFWPRSLPRFRTADSYLRRMAPTPPAGMLLPSAPAACLLRPHKGWEYRLR